MGKYIYSTRPVRQSTADRLNRETAWMDPNSGSRGVSIGNLHYVCEGGVWTREIKTINPEWLKAWAYEVVFDAHAKDCNSVCFRYRNGDRWKLVRAEMNRVCRAILGKNIYDNRKGIVRDGAEAVLFNPAKRPCFTFTKGKFMRTRKA